MGQGITYNVKIRNADIRSRRNQVFKLFCLTLLLVVGAFAVYLYYGMILGSGNSDREKSSIPWPTKGWKFASPNQVGMNEIILEDMKKAVIKDQLGVDSIVIVRNGYIVLEEYYHGYNNEDLHNIFSSTKSIISALIGIAQTRGEYPDLDAKVLDLFTTRNVKNVDEWKRALTIRDLLKMTSGFDLNEGLSVGPDYWAFLNSSDPTQFSLDLPMRSEPGTRFYYSSPDIHLATRILVETVKSTPLEYANKHLFGPLNITKIEWPTDPDGNQWGQTYLKLKPRDMAKIGYLYLNDGRWEDKQIISTEWIQESTRLHINITSSYGYGYYWWVVPGKYYYAMGAQGQYIFVVPDKNVVAVFTCSSFLSHYTPIQLLTTYVLPSVA